MKVALIILVSALFLACQQQGVHHHSTEQVKPNNTETKDKTKNKIYNGRGVVTKINPELVSVELDHEEIEGLMPAMIMEFYVRNKSELEALQVGDKVDFVLEYDQGKETIISIKKIP